MPDGGSRAGDLFQANLCLRLEGGWTATRSTSSRTAAAALPTDRAAFVAGPWGTVASLSPELFLEPRGPDRRGARRSRARGPRDRRAELGARRRTAPRT